jgi:hypothetical protein
MNTKILSLTVKWPFIWYFIFKNKDKVPSLEMNKIYYFMLIEIKAKFLPKKTEK